MDALNVDEMVGQLLASEGFASVEEVAYVDNSEVASIEGFDEDTAPRSRTAQRSSSTSARRSSTTSARALGVEDDLRQVEGLTTACSSRLARTA